MFSALEARHLLFDPASHEILLNSSISYTKIYMYYPYFLLNHSTYVKIALKTVEQFIRSKLTDSGRDFIIYYVEKRQVS